MSTYYDVVAVSSSSDILKFVGENEGVRIKGIEMTPEITLGKDIKAFWDMYQFLRKEKRKIDICKKLNIRDIKIKPAFIEFLSVDRD